jgi:hypothetical protein
MFIGHLGLSYLISQAPRAWGKKLSIKEVIFLLVVGYILDLDLFITGLAGVNHHYLGVHTPVSAFYLGLLLYFLLRGRISKTALFLVFPVLLGHLVLDDIAYWFHILGWQAWSQFPQINWLYPFAVQGATDFSQLNFLEIIRFYIIKAPVNAFLEVILVLLALFVFSSRKK